MYIDATDNLGPSARYAVLSANTARTLREIDDRAPDVAEQLLLGRAAALVEGILNGSRFVEHSQQGALSNPQSELFTLSHAVAALQSLTHGAPPELTKEFQQLHEDLIALAEGSQQVDPQRLDSMTEFFRALATLFYEDIANRSQFRADAHLR